MQEHYLTERGLYYRTNTFVEGRPTLVFVHGVTGSSSAWQPHEVHLSNTYNILTYDLRGHGKSKKYAHFDDYGIEKFADDLSYLIDFLGIQNCILVSHSFGTIIALTYLEKPNTEIRGAIFLSPILSPWNNATSWLILPMLQITRFFSLFPFTERTASHIDYKRFPNSFDADIPRIIAEVKNTGVRVVLYCLRKTFAVDFRKNLPEYASPTLILHGRKDTISPLKNSLTLNAHIQSSKLVIIENADHIIVINHIKRVCDEITTFLSENKS